MSVEKDQVSQSFGRCCLSAGFFDDFYDGFFQSSPRVRDKFRNTNMAKQKSLLREGITFMIMFYDGSSVAGSKVKRLADSHSQGKLGIEPDLYKFWLDSLMKVVAKHDPKFTPQLDRVWRTVMGKGIAAISGGYARSVA